LNLETVLKVLNYRVRYTIPFILNGKEIILVENRCKCMMEIYKVAMEFE